MTPLRPVKHGRRKGATTVVMVAEDVVSLPLQVVLEQVFVATHGCVGRPLGNVARTDHESRFRYVSINIFRVWRSRHLVHCRDKREQLGNVPVRLHVLIGPPEKRQSNLLLLRRQKKGKGREKKQKKNERRFQGNQ